MPHPAKQWTEISANMSTHSSARPPFPSCNVCQVLLQSTLCVVVRRVVVSEQAFTQTGRRGPSISSSTTRGARYGQTSDHEARGHVTQKPGSMVSFSARQGQGDIFVHPDVGRELMPVTLFWVLESLVILIDGWPKLRYTLSGSLYKMGNLHELGQRQMAATAVTWNFLFLGWKAQ